MKETIQFTIISFIRINFTKKKKKRRHEGNIERENKFVTFVEESLEKVFSS